MNYFAPKPIRVFDFFTSIEGETVFHLAEPTEATAPMRRVLDAAHPDAARRLVEYLQNRHPDHQKRQTPKVVLAAFLTWLDYEQIGLWQATRSDLARYLNSLTSRHTASTIHRHLAIIQGLYGYLRNYP